MVLTWLYPPSWPSTSTTLAFDAATGGVRARAGPCQSRTLVLSLVPPSPWVARL